MIKFGDFFRPSTRRECCGCWLTRDQDGPRCIVCRRLATPWETTLDGLHPDNLEWTSPGPTMYTAHPPTGQSGGAMRPRHKPHRPPRRPTGDHQLLPVMADCGTTCGMGPHGRDGTGQRKNSRQRCMPDLRGRRK
eukprot:8457168-Pyramimonas_sp.AAC.1